MKFNSKVKIKLALDVNGIIKNQKKSVKNKWQEILQQMVKDKQKLIWLKKHWLHNVQNMVQMVLVHQAQLLTQYCNVYATKQMIHTKIKKREFGKTQKHENNAAKFIGKNIITS